MTRLKCFRAITLQTRSLAVVYVHVQTFTVNLHSEIRRINNNNNNKQWQTMSPWKPKLLR